MTTRTEPVTIGLLIPGADAYGTPMWTPVLAEFPSGAITYTYPAQTKHAKARALVLDGLRDVYKQPLRDEAREVAA